MKNINTKYKNGAKIDDSGLPFEIEKCQWIIHRRDIITLFAQRTNNLCSEEMEAFHDHFEDIWHQLYSQIYEIASNELEQDLDTYLFEIGQLERAERGTSSPRKLTVPQKTRRHQQVLQNLLRKRQVRQRIHRALNP